MLSAKLSLPFKFTPIPVAVLTVLIYAAVFGSVLHYDELATIPRDLQGLDLDRGFEALTKVRFPNFCIPVVRPRHLGKMCKLSATARRLYAMRGSQNGQNMAWWYTCRNAFPWTDHRDIYLLFTTPLEL